MLIKYTDKGIRYEINDKDTPAYTDGMELEGILELKGIPKLSTSDSLGTCGGINEATAE